MPSLKTILISTFTGIFICIAWWFFIDGVITEPDSFPWVHIVPIFGIMVSMFAINMVSPNRIEQASGPTRLWLFFWFTNAITCVGISIWITTVEYPPNHNWPGVTIILHTMFMFFAGILFFIGRFSQESEF
ncbi:UPF0220 family protein [Flavobacteriaceae bacterium]|nr:UPF0220 family protein [Flavobacteriaceae bacterium]